MGIIRATLHDLSKLLGVKEHQLDVVKEEKSARAALSRRGLFKAVGAIAAGTLFTESVPYAIYVVNPRFDSRTYTWGDITVMVDGVPFPSIQNLSFDPVLKKIEGTITFYPSTISGVLINSSRKVVT
jgi:hypothetical protein